MCLGAILVCLACAGTRLQRVLAEVTAPVEKALGHVNALALGQTYGIRCIRPEALGQGPQ